MWWVAMIACVHPYEDGDLPFPEVPELSPVPLSERLQGACERTRWFPDTDGDGFGAGAPVLACEAPDKHVAQADDCDDADPRRFPGAPDVCDEIDNDCDLDTPDRGAATDGTFHLTLQDALDATSSGRIDLCPGVFTASIEIAGEIELRGAGRDVTVLEPDGKSGVLAVKEGATLHLAGVTVRGGSAEVGGGIAVLPGASLVMEDAVVTDNVAVDGGGLFIEGNAVLRHVLLLGNEADEQGGGVFAASGSSVVLDGVQMVENKPDALHSDGASVVSITPAGTTEWVEPRQVVPEPAP